MKSANKVRGAVAALTAAACIGSLGIMAKAADVRSSDVRVLLDGGSYSGTTRLIDGTTYVKLREFSELHGASVEWDQSTATAHVRHDDFELSVGCNDVGLMVNGYYLWFKGSTFVDAERIYIPLRAIGSAFGYNTTWNEWSATASLASQVQAPTPTYTEDELYWLSKIISAEAEGEPMEGKIAVGTVVLNRVRDEEFPNTIYGVIFDRKNGVQFTPVLNGEIYGEPDEESILAAKLCLEGYTASDDILFFLNVELAESFWITKNRSYVMTIGNHEFYS